MADPRNVLFSKLTSEDGHYYRVPSIEDFDELKKDKGYGITPDKEYDIFWKHALWRLGDDGTISVCVVMR